MSQQRWPQPSRPIGGGGSAGGSVRRARERVQAGLPPEMPQAPPQRPSEPTKVMAPSPPQNRARPQMPQALVGQKNAQAPIGVAISRPTQVPQWPLVATVEGTPDPRSKQYQPPAGRGAPPQRPPRPSRVPSMLDASRVQDHTPSFQYKPQNAPEQSRGKAQYQEEDVMSPGITSPVTMSSRPSTTSSVGTIPDFPVPMPITVPAMGPPRRSANLGPPPISRRGASSYYSQASYVSPIPEESPRTQLSHESYASSAAIPTSWGSESPGFRFEDDDEDYEDDYRGSRRYLHEPIEEGRESRESNGDDSDDRGLIRSASLGKRAKPSVVTTKSSELTRPAPMPQQPSKLERMGVLDGGAIATAMNASKLRDGQRETMWPAIGDAASPLAGGTGLIDKSTSSSDESVPQVARAVTSDEPVSDYHRDAAAKEMLGAYNAASSLKPARTPSPGFSRLSAIRRPPRLDMDAVRDAEARGSLTSLPDLIKRATRLAAMMDKGRRPASRLNDLNDFGSDIELAKEKELGSVSSDEKHQSGLSGMLAAFPPPGLATPMNGTPTRPASAWPSPYGQSSSAGLDPNSRNGGAKKGRRCCGLPCWGFLLLLLILLIIIAAAVVVPLEFLVFHKSKTTPTAKLSELQQCEASSSTACQNGGTSIIDNGSCGCICTNGFTGPTCTFANDTGCTSISLPSSDGTSTVNNVTLGDSILRLIQDSQTNFSVPLFSSVILARFNSANLTCASENALVTFDGESTRLGAAMDKVDPVSTTAAPTPTGLGSGQSNRRRGSASTSNGIVFDGASPSTVSESAPIETASSPPSTSNTDSTGIFTATQLVLDFARVTVLFVLQQEELNAAVTAQDALQTFFSLQSNLGSFTNAAASNVSLGNGNWVDLVTFRLDLGNGTVGSVNATSYVGRRTVLSPIIL